MLFSHELESYRKDVDDAINELLLACRKNQVHDADLLLVFNHTRRDTKYELGLMAGYDHRVHAELEQAKFISQVRKAIVLKDKAELTEKEAIPEMKGIEELSIHAEMLLYLKIWESDMHQRILYHLASLANSQSYDWEFQLTGDVSGILGGIRKKLANVSPLASALLKELYDPALRNVIAHSQYYFADRIIVQLNSEGEPITPLTFDDWRRIISKTLLFHNSLQVLSDRVLDEYREKSKITGGIIQVLVRQKDGSFQNVAFSPMKNRKYWVWTANLLASRLTPEP